MPLYLENASHAPALAANGSVWIDSYVYKWMLGELTPQKICEAFCSANEEGLLKSCRELCDYHKAQLQLEPPY